MTNKPTPEQLARECADRGNTSEGCEEWQDRYYCFLSGYAAAQSQDAPAGVARWVKVTEKLPEKNGDYIVVITDHYKMSGFYDGLWSSFVYNDLDPTHWLDNVPPVPGEK